MFVLGRAHASGNPMYRAEVANDSLKGITDDTDEPFSFRYNKDTNHVVLYIGGTDWVIDFLKSDSGYGIYKRNLMNDDERYRIQNTEELIGVFQLSPWFKNELKKI